MDTTNAKSLLQANATILAGALIFLTLLNEKFDLLTTSYFLIGIWLIIGSILFCLWTKDVEKNKISIERARRGLCMAGLFSLFVAITTFLWSKIFLHP